MSAWSCPPITWRHGRRGWVADGGYVTALQEPERWSIQDLVGRGSPDDDDEPDEDMSY